MWVFLLTEVLFFGGLFVAQGYYRSAYPGPFREASNRLDLALGTANTLILLASSFTMALAVHGAERGGRRILVGGILLTILLGSIFLGIKTVEYRHKAAEGWIPGPGFGPRERGLELFFAFYFGMTGMHALHMVVGIVALSVVALRAWGGRYGPEDHTPVALTGLYWHFVDIVWIFLFPALYLQGRHAS
jgi:cytochrome c oxidase subunit 3